MVIRRKLAVFEENLEMLLIRCISKTYKNNEDKNTLQRSNVFPLSPVMMIQNWANLRSKSFSERNLQQ